MLFNSLTFLVFYLAVLAIYFRLRWRAQNALILVSSCLFYGWWDYRFLLLMGISVTTDYFAGLAISRCDGGRKRKLLLAVSIAFNLGILGFFKYFNFFVHSLERLLDSVGLPFLFPGLNIVLPVGISFYTFQSMSYSIDMYRGQIQPTRRYVDYAAFVSFFPQLVAGPIERASHLLPQFHGPRTVTRERLRQSLWLILWGLYKKVVIADNLAAIVDPVFSWHEPLSGGMVLIALYAFAMQIYCDFSGYSDMAKGLAGCMGFDLMHNFRIPYLARNPQMFWKRWHVSLSTWLRDYLYVPLGGNRGGRAQTYRNLFLTMLIGGLWHGAAWTFVCWGAYQGFVLIVHRAWTEWRGSASRAPAGRLAKAIHWAIMFHAVCLGWLLFRADSMFQVWTFLKTLATDFSGSARAAGHLAALVFLCLPLWLVERAQENNGDLDAPLRVPVAIKALLIAVLAILIVGVGNTGTKQFIYFQF